MFTSLRLLSPVLTGLLIACSPEQSQNISTSPAADASADKQIEAELHRHIAILASDSFEGRAPATRGEELTTSYLREQFMALGLTPGNGDSYFQQVPVTEITAAEDMRLSLRGSNYSVDLSFGEQMVVATEQLLPEIALENSEMLFLGYGINAPERQWNDYEGLDVSGKTVVMLINDPGFATQDPALFNGNAMTWYGRWVYKFEEAARQGAAGVLIIHETAAAAYGWNVVRDGWTGPQIRLSDPDLNADKSRVIGWLTNESARALFAGAGLDFDALVSAAAQPGFGAVPIGDIRASVSLRNSIRNSVSNNVIGTIPGTARPDDSIIYTAHWDHLGMNPNLQGDQIYNGARDNATGTAALLELARLFSELPEGSQRTVAFLAVAAEESGLLGSQWYAENPLLPLATTVANINMDSPTVAGPMRDMVVIGFGNSELDAYLDQALAGQAGRYLAPEPNPQLGLYYRSDHFNFAKQGVPALYAKSGEDSAVHGREWGSEQEREYVALRYHSVADGYAPDWDLSGVAQDVQLYFAVGRRLAQESSYPNWSEGNEFKAIRDASAALRGM
jgi:Zn-dependent M28 family amino/carboxypeptidase